MYVKRKTNHSLMSNMQKSPSESHKESLLIHIEFSKDPPFNFKQQLRLLNFQKSP